MKRTFFFLLLFACLISCKSNEKTISDSPVEEVVPQLKYGIPILDYFVKGGVVKNGDYFGGLLLDAGLSNNELQQVLSASKGIFDITKIKVGNTYEFLFAQDSANIQPQPAYFIYERDALSHIVFSLKDSVYVKVVEKEIAVKKKYVEVTINTSLWNDVMAAGSSPVLALKLADIYAWTIDFFGLQQGDSFKAIYDELSYNGEFIDISNVYYAEFTHNAKQFTSVRFVDGEKGNIYWNENGESLRKAFLKAPLSFSRISSKFTYKRKHPIYKIVRPHTGVDYAAPKGTPVMSIGDGVVVSKGWGGGGGNTVKIKHNSVYTTAYLHLSGYAKGLKKGTRVKQGEIIGYVGSTGASTGPHLDFRVWKNGTPVDPLKLESPSVEPVSKANMEAFKTTYKIYKNELDSLACLKYVNKLIEIL